MYHKRHKVANIKSQNYHRGDMYTYVIDAYQGWHDNHTEWVGTQIIWEVQPRKDGTRVKMTHVGLVPDFECFEKCNQGWNYLRGKSLQKYFESDEGMPA